MKRILLLLFCLIALSVEAKVRPLVWVLDAGHGGLDQGTSSKSILEKDLTLKITREVAALLQKNKPGIRVVLTRTDDRTLSLSQRCRIANNAGADLFLSIHINYAPSKASLSGTESFFPDPKRLGKGGRTRADRSELLAWLLQKNYHESGRPSGRGAKASRLYVCVNTRMPAVLTEVGFLSNAKDAAYMTTTWGQKDIANQIFNALMEYYTTTQAGTQTKTLRNLRRTAGTYSGLQVKKHKTAANPPRPVAESKKKDADKQPTAQAVAKPNPIVQDTVPAIATEQQDMAQSIVDGIETQEKDDVAVVSEGEVEVEEKDEASSPAVPVYSIQVVCVSKELPSDDPRLLGLYPVTFVQAGTVYKGLYGGTTDYEQAKLTLAEIRTKFPDAFIVAYLGEKPITTAEALRMTAK